MDSGKKDEENNEEDEKDEADEAEERTMPQSRSNGFGTCTF